MADKWSDNEVLEIFLKRTQEITNLPIWKEKGLRYKVNINYESGEVTYTEPDEDQFRSFLMSLRLFLMQDEPTYFFDVRNSAYRLLNPNLPDLEVKQEYLRGLKKAWNDAMKSEDFFVGVVDGEVQNPEEILSAYINGHYFHTDKKHQQNLRDYADSLIPMERTVFLSIIFALTMQLQNLMIFVYRGIQNDWFQSDE